MQSFAFKCCCSTYAPNRTTFLDWSIGLCESGSDQKTDVKAVVSPENLRNCWKRYRELERHKGNILRQRDLTAGSICYSVRGRETLGCWDSDP